MSSITNGKKKPQRTTGGGAFSSIQPQPQLVEPQPLRQPPQPPEAPPEVPPKSLLCSLPG